MPSIANVAIHASQFPEQVRHDLLESLGTRQVNHKFHYDSIKQTQQWLALHQTCSPSRNDKNYAETYDRGFDAVAARIDSARTHVVGLGCGGGQKDTRLLKLLKARGKKVAYTPCDVSAAMVLVARQAALAAVSGSDCFPLVCDLATADDLPEVLGAHGPRDATRLITFFGMIPNFEPQLILPRLTRLLRPGDCLLFGANLAPGPDYASGMQRVLPQYDNPLTRNWLMTFLFDLGVERSDGDLRFAVEDDPVGRDLKRIAAHFHFLRLRELQIDEERFAFRAGESIRLFFSYRHTPALVRTLLDRQRLEVIDEWITKSEEEGVFLVLRQK